MSATSAVRVPMPPMNGTGMRSPKSARLGIVCTTLAAPSTRRCQAGRASARCRAARRRRSRVPTDTTTSSRCRPVSVRISPATLVAPGLRGTPRTAGSSRGRELVRRAARRAAGRPRGAPSRSATRAASRRSWVTKTRRLPELSLERAELVLQLAPRDRIERAERLVEEQQRRVGGERACHADALALAARELVRIASPYSAAGSPTSSSSSSTRARRRRRPSPPAPGRCRRSPRR